MPELAARGIFAVSFMVTIVASLLRTSLLCCLALSVGVLLQPLLNNGSKWKRRSLWAVLLAPFFCPDLLVGYAYANFSLSLVHHPFLNELFYATLVGFKIIPAATTLIYFTPPPPISKEAFHCRAMLEQPFHQPKKKRFLNKSLWPFRARGPWLRLIPAAGLTFLVTFQEFEICSLMNTTSWTLTLFDAHVTAGWELSETFRLARFPLLIETLVVALLIGAAWFWKQSSSLANDQTQEPTTIGKRGLGGLYLFLGLSLIVLVPAGLIFRDTLTGWQVFLSNRSLLRETGYACGYAGLSGLLAHATAYYWLKRGQLGWLSKVCLGAICFPGLCGSFLLSLSLLYLFQNSPLHHWYNTPFPLILGLYLFVLPRAFLIQLVRKSLTQNESIFLGNLLKNSPITTQQKMGDRLQWQQRIKPQLICFLPLFYWNYWDMTAPSILAPLGAMPAPLRIYNFMHYGRGTGLSSLVSATITAPCFLILISFVLFQFLNSARNRFRSK